MQKIFEAANIKTSQINGRVDRASASGVVDSALIPRRVKSMTIKWYSQLPYA